MKFLSEYFKRLTAFSTFFKWDNKTKNKNKNKNKKKEEEEENKRKSVSREPVHSMFEEDTVNEAEWISKAEIRA